MADKEVTETFLVNPEATLERTKFYASSLDAFMQDFLEKAMGNDRLGTIVAAARVAQMATAVAQENLRYCVGLIQSATEQKAAQQAAVLVVDMVNANARVVGFSIEEEEPSQREGKKEQLMN